jgi:branched-chain amino acid transport system permease protein
MAKLFYLLPLAAVTVALPSLLDEYWMSVIIFMAINILMVAGIRNMWLVGNISLGQGGFSLVGAYCSGLLAMRFGMSFWVTLVIAGTLSAVIALALSYPFLKAKGVYFAVLTLAASETMRLVAWHWGSLTGGASGIRGIPSPAPVDIPILGVFDFSVFNDYYYLVLAIVWLTLSILYKMERSHLGFVWKCINDSDSLAHSLGVNVFVYKTITFVAASFFAGVAGALVAHLQGGLAADSGSRFNIATSIYFVACMVVGGDKYFAGPIIGTIVLTILSEVGRPLGEYVPMLTGGVMIGIAIFFSGGIVDVFYRIKSRVRTPSVSGKANHSGSPKQ